MNNFCYVLLQRLAHSTAIALCVLMLSMFVLHCNMPERLWMPWNLSGACATTWNALLQGSRDCNLYGKAGGVQCCTDF